MPDEEGNEKLDEDEGTETSLHAHDESREDDIVGDPTPDAEQRDKDEDEDEDLADSPTPDKH